MLAAEATTQLIKYIRKHFSEKQIKKEPKLIVTPHFVI